MNAQEIIAQIKEKEQSFVQAQKELADERAKDKNGFAEEWEFLPLVNEVTRLRKEIKELRYSLGTNAGILAFSRKRIKPILKEAGVIECEGKNSIIKMIDFDHMPNAVEVHANVNILVDIAIKSYVGAVMLIVPPFMASELEKQLIANGIRPIYPIFIPTITETGTVDTFKGWYDASLA